MTLRHVVLSIGVLHLLSPPATSTIVRALLVRQVDQLRLSASAGMSCI